MSIAGQKTETCTFLILLVFWICVANSDQKHTIKEIKALSDRLMVNYSKHILPTESEPLDVDIIMWLEAMGNIDEIEETLASVISFYYLWKDESIVWNKEETNISYITLGWNDVWKPVLQLMNPQADSAVRSFSDHSYDSVIYSNDGSAFYDELLTTRTSCDLDMSYYPFDAHTCEIKMRLFGSTKFGFILNVYIDESFSKEDAEHGSWKLTNVKVTESFYSNGEFVIELNFERRPFYVLLNIIFPLLVLALLTPIVFVLPKKSGERVGYAVAMLLAISVYMTIVSEHLPHNSKPAPLMPVMIFVLYSFDALVLLVVIVNTNINLTGANKQMPTVLRQFVVLNRRMSCQRTQTMINKASVEEIQRCIEMVNVNGKEEIERGEARDNESNELGCTESVTWQELSHAIDKWFFVISYLLKVALPVIFLTLMKVKSETIN